MSDELQHERNRGVGCRDGLSALADRFWIAAGKVAMALWVSHLVLKLDALIPSPLRIGLWSLALSLALAGVSFVIWLQGLPHALEAVWSLFRLFREWRAGRRADNEKLCHAAEKPKI